MTWIKLCKAPINRDPDINIAMSLKIEIILYFKKDNLANDDKACYNSNPSL